MNKKQNTIQDIPSQEESQRLTLGFICYGGEDTAVQGLWAGLDDVTREHGVNLINYPGQPLQAPESFAFQANVLYDFIDKRRVDGLVVFAGALGHYVGSAAVKEFLTRYREIPMVNVSLAMDGVPGILIDNYRGTHQVVSHLIEEHSYSRIAFVRGPEGHSEAEERYRAYVDALTEHGLDVDAVLVTPGSFLEESGHEAVATLFDERNAHPDAIVTINDQVAYGVLDALAARDMHVPQDVAVAGFDDRPESQFTTPPLTTALQSWYEIGYQAAESLLAQMRGAALPEVIEVQPRLIVRQSCGCMPPEIRSCSVAYTALEKTATPLTEVREDVLSEVVEVAGEAAAGLDTGWAAALWDAFLADLDDNESRQFLSLLETYLRLVPGRQLRLVNWQQALSAMRCGLLPYLAGRRRQHAENVWQQARVLIGNWMGRLQASARLVEQEQSQRLNALGDDLVSVGDLAELLDIIARDLPMFDIPRCYLSLYENPSAPTTWSRLLLAYDEQGRIDVDAYTHFPSPLLVPGGLLEEEERFSIQVEPLYFREEQLGFAVFYATPWQGGTYDAIRTQISSALKSVLLREQLERRAYQIQTAFQVAREVSSTLERDVLIRRVVELVRERFGLYYVGLFLVDQTGEWTDEPGRWAVLRAGTGKAGQQMLAERHKLEIGGSSMIGTAVAAGEARIALDVGEEAVRFDNPLLPETHSEMALPLISRDRVIGALTIQSAERGAFSEEDIAVLQTMASQVAIAIENTRLFEQTQEALAEMEATQRRYLRRAWSEYERKVSRTHYEVTRPGAPPVDEALTEKVERALGEGKSQVVAPEDDMEPTGSAVVAPSLLRGALVGGVTVYDDSGEREWTEDEIALMEVVAERMAIIAENMRLLDETQRRAAREQLTGEVTARMRESLDMETVLRTAVQDIREVMDLPAVTVRLTNPPEDEDDGGAGSEA